MTVLACVGALLSELSGLTGVGLIFGVPAWLTMTLVVCGSPEGRIATLDNAFAGRETFTLSAEVAALSIARIWRTVREWKARFEEYQVPADQIQKIAPPFRHIDDVSTQALRKLIP